MPEITGGRVVFARTVQPAQFESKRVEAEMSFIVADGEDPAAALAEVGELVRRGALDLLGAGGDDAPGRSRRTRPSLRDED
jgi:hypothetical protein